MKMANRNCKCSFGLFKINLKYFDVDKMRGKVEKIYLKYLDADKKRAEVRKYEWTPVNGPSPIYYIYSALV